jgi:hypothetical protein
VKVAIATKAKVRPIRSHVLRVGGEPRVKERRRKMAERRARKASTAGEMRCGFMVAKQHPSG